MNLAYRMRPQTLDEFVGQDQLVGENKLIRKMLENGEDPKFIARRMIFFLPEKLKNKKGFES